MSFKKIKCPHCSGELKFDASEPKFKCPSCGSLITYDEKSKKASVEKTSSGTESAGKAKQRRKNKSLFIALGVTGGVILLAAVLAAVFWHQIVNWLYHPTIDPHADDTETAQTAVVSGETAPVTEKDPNEKKDDIYNFLICGHDRVADNTDVNLLVSFNTSNLTAAIMQIPRDIYVNHDYNGAHKCNTVFQYFKYGGNSTDPDIQAKIDKYDISTEGDMRGITGFAAFLEKNTGIRIHYYAVMDLTQFSNIVDALGGVEMNVPFDLHYDDPNQNLHIHINSGYQVLDGYAAEGVVRYRSGYANADIGRGNVQKLFMVSLFKTMKDKANIFNIGKISEVCTIVKENLVTNMQTDDLIYFANNAMTLDLQYVTFMTMPGAGFWGDDGLAYYTLNKDLTIQYLNSYFKHYGAPITDESFDPNGVFANGSYYYSCPASEIPEYIYKGSDMAADGFVPTVGY